MTKIITITGDLGSGKSTVSKILIDRLNYGYVYTGKIQREIAAKYNMTTLELNQYAENNPKIDIEIDAVFKSLNDANDDLIVDSRLAWHFIPKSFKVYLKTDVNIAAKRIFGDKLRKSEKKFNSVEEVIIEITQRKTSENKRFLELYNVDCSDMSNFDMVVDTTQLTPEEVAKRIIVAHRTP